VVKGSLSQPVETFRKLQHRVPCARIGQLPGHFPRLPCAAEPFQGFGQFRGHRVLPLGLGLSGLSRPIRSRSTDAYPSHATASDEAAFQIAAQSPSDESRAKRSAGPGPSFVAASSVAGSARGRAASEVLGWARWRNFGPEYMLTGFSLSAPS